MDLQELLPAPRRLERQLQGDFSLFRLHAFEQRTQRTRQRPGEGALLTALGFAERDLADAVCSVQINVGQRDHGLAQAAAGVQSDLEGDAHPLGLGLECGLDRLDGVVIKLRLLGRLFFFQAELGERIRGDVADSSCLGQDEGEHLQVSPRGVPTGDLAGALRRLGAPVHVIQSGLVADLARAMQFTKLEPVGDDLPVRPVPRQRLLRLAVAGKEPVHPTHPGALLFVGSLLAGGAEFFDLGFGTGDLGFLRFAGVIGAQAEGHFQPASLRVPEGEVPKRGARFSDHRGHGSEGYFSHSFPTLASLRGERVRGIEPPSREGGSFEWNLVPQARGEQGHLGRPFSHFSHPNIFPASPGTAAPSELGAVAGPLASRSATVPAVFLASPAMASASVQSMYRGAAESTGSVATEAPESHDLGGGCDTHPPQLRGTTNGEVMPDGTDAIIVAAVPLGRESDVKLPVIIEPFSTFGDEVAGETPDEVALNLAACTRTSLFWRCKPRREMPDLRAAFRGCRLSEETKNALRWVCEVYARKTPKLEEAA